MSLTFRKCSEIYFEQGVREGYLVVEDGRIVDFLGCDVAIAT